MKDISKEFRAEIRKRVKRDPDFTYEPPGDSAGCKYLNPKNGAGSCLVGRGLLAVGASRNVLKNADNPAAQQGAHATYVVHDSLRSLDMDVDSETASWARAIQFHQDRGERWDYALAMADDRYPDIAHEDRVTA